MLVVFIEEVLTLHVVLSKGERRSEFCGMLFSRKSLRRILLFFKSDLHIF